MGDLSLQGICVDTGPLARVQQLGFFVHINRRTARLWLHGSPRTSTAARLWRTAELETCIVQDLEVVSAGELLDTLPIGTYDSTDQISYVSGTKMGTSQDMLEDDVMSSEMEQGSLHEKEEKKVTDEIMKEWDPQLNEGEDPWYPLTQKYLAHLVYDVQMATEYNIRVDQLSRESLAKEDLKKEEEKIYHDLTTKYSDKIGKLLNIVDPHLETDNLTKTAYGIKKGDVAYRIWLHREGFLARVYDRASQLVTDMLGLSGAVGAGLPPRPATQVRVPSSGIS
ncbi:hypothetical protein GOP47_0013534 [Adiantum capillus-veneris]|uniref:Uncharacterized protein n=1 Tax=Adiantum capillus-veneris TaxID=13818 RepID=A0A9D4UPY7_ADICA|nr:hypothetical protein GOP47_0013534 [Adiantum capillus-veneris]